MRKAWSASGSASGWMLVLALAGVLLAAGCQRSVQAPNPFTIDAREYDRIYQASIEVLREAGYHVRHSNHRYGEIIAAPKPSPTAFEPWDADNTTDAQAWRSTLDELRRRVRIRLVPGTADQVTATAPAGDGGGRSDQAALAAALSPDTAENGQGGGDTQPATRSARSAGASTQTVTGPATRPAGTRPATPEAYALLVEVQMERQQVPVRRLTGSVRTGLFSRLDNVPVEWRRRGIEARYWQPIGRDPYLEQRLVRRIVHRSMQMPPQ